MHVKLYFILSRKVSLGVEVGVRVVPWVRRFGHLHVYSVVSLGSQSWVPSDKLVIAQG